MSMNVLKAEELMVGDWVLVDDINAWKIGATMPARVKQIYECGIIIDCGEGNEECEIFKPVPLTAEILEKNKYYYNDIRHEWATDSYSFYIEFGHGLSDEGQPDHLFVWVGNCHVVLQYVHELQHVLRMCGITHEIII